MKRNIFMTVLFSLILISASVFCIIKPSDSFSQSERRELAEFPSFSFEALASGEFSENFETYSTERFPYRDAFRRIKAEFSYKILRRLDNNGLFTAEGHISKLDTQLNDVMLEYASDKFEYLYTTYLQDRGMNIYFSVIPDKNYYLAEENSYPSYDYESLFAKMREKTDYMQYIDVTDLLSAEKYYRTDTHWRQEEITDVADRILQTMGVQTDYEYNVNVLDTAFYGVYFGQLAMPFEADEMKYLTNATIDSFSVNYYDTGAAREGAVYNTEKAHGKDTYDMFLSGATPLVTIENQKASTDRELIIFRDSFGSSLAPLLAQGYSKTTVVDIRYLQSAYLGQIVEFANGSDVLFVYSTTLLNNSLALQ